MTDPGPSRYVVQITGLAFRAGTELAAAYRDAFGAAVLAVDPAATVYNSTALTLDHLDAHADLRVTADRPSTALAMIEQTFERSGLDLPRTIRLLTL